MKQKTIIASLLLVFTVLFAFQHDASAQRVVRAKHARVVKRNRVTVVHVRHPRVRRKAHIRYAGLPRWGSVTVAAPAGAVLINHANTAFYFHSGIYYVQRPAGYTVVRPVRGLRIRVLPVGYRRVVVAKKTYYYYYGTFYAKSGDEYEVIDAPVGAIVDAVPDGYDVKTVGDTEYYVLDNVYYAEVDDSNIEGGVGYEVVNPS